MICLWEAKDAAARWCGGGCGVMVLWDGRGRSGEGRLFGRVEGWKGAFDKYTVVFDQKSNNVDLTLETSIPSSHLEVTP